MKFQILLFCFQRFFFPSFDLDIARKKIIHLKLKAKLWLQFGSLSNSFLHEKKRVNKQFSGLLDLQLGNFMNVKVSHISSVLSAGGGEARFGHQITPHQSAHFACFFLINFQRFFSIHTALICIYELSTLMAGQVSTTNNLTLGSAHWRVIWFIRKVLEKKKTL